mgnify:CR=1 FL=1
MDLNELKVLAELMRPEKPKPQSLFGIPQNLAIVVVLIIGILVYWNDNRGKSEFEVELASDIKVLKTDVTSLKLDVSDIKSAKDADRQLINGMTGNRYTREDHYEYARTQTEIDQKQWDAINEIRSRLKAMD